MRSVNPVIICTVLRISLYFHSRICISCVYFMYVFMLPLCLPVHIISVCLFWSQIQGLWILEPASWVLDPGCIRVLDPRLQIPKAETFSVHSGNHATCRSLQQPRFLQRIIATTLLQLPTTTLHCAARCNSLRQLHVGAWLFTTAATMFLAALYGNKRLAA